jgi:hypothetical protein
MLEGHIQTHGAPVALPADDAMAGVVLGHDDLEDGLDRVYAAMLLMAGRHAGAGAARWIEERWERVMDNVDPATARSRPLAGLARAFMDLLDSEIPEDEVGAGERNVPAERTPLPLRPDGGWYQSPAPLDGRALGSACRSGAVRRTLLRLPRSTSAVVLLRDVAGLPVDDVQFALGIDSTRQKQLLHAGRLELWHVLDSGARSRGV